MKSAKEWDKVGVEVLQGAAIGFGAICVAPVKIGHWALVGGGAVVTKDVKDHALVVGNPSRQVGWVGKSGKNSKPWMVSILNVRFWAPNIE